jgi:hypothetical protein
MKNLICEINNGWFVTNHIVRAETREEVEAVCQTNTKSFQDQDNPYFTESVVGEMSEMAYAKLDRWMKNLQAIGPVSWLCITNTSSEQQERYHVTARFINGPAKDIDVFIDIF